MIPSASGTMGLKGAEIRRPSGVEEKKSGRGERLKI